MKRQLRPESQMMSEAYDPASSFGSVKIPLFLTSTFEFESAEEGKAFFEVAYGLRNPDPNSDQGMIYSRINNPNMEILERRLCLWDQTEACAVFGSGMAAISTTLLEFLRPGDLLLYSAPTYGGTDHFIHESLAQYGIQSIRFRAGQSKEEIIQMVYESGHADRLSFIFIETPANPTNDIFDISMFREIAEHFKSPQNEILIGVDNTFMGPLWSHPIQHGADLVLYSATKYIGGHSDLIAGAVLGDEKYIHRIKGLRTFLGSMPSPHTCWLLTRSLETLQVRMERQMRNAQLIAGYLASHPMVEKVYYLGLIPEGTNEYILYKKQYDSPGAMVAFNIAGGEEEAFLFMNSLRLFKLAVSLGSTESLVQHPASMTHAGIPIEERENMGVSDKMIRLSIGLEHPDDLIRDIENAFDQIQVNKLYDLQESSAHAPMN